MSDNDNQKNATDSQQLLAAGNAAFRAGDYVLAITYFEAAQQQMPAMAEIIATNIARAMSKLSGEMPANTTLPDVMLSVETLQGSNFRTQADTPVSGVAIECNTPQVESSKPSCLVCIDTLDSAGVTGWALASDVAALDMLNEGTLTEQPIFLTFTLQGKPIAQGYTQLPREDVKQAHGGAGVSGFTVCLNRFASFSSERVLQAIPAHYDVASSHMAMAEKPWPALLAGHYKVDIDSIAQQLALRFVSPALPDPASAPLSFESSFESSLESSVSHTVIIVTCNELMALQRCLLALLRCNSEAEIIVVDQASTDGTAAFLKSFIHPRVNVLLHDTALHDFSLHDAALLGTTPVFSECAQRAVAVAKGDVLVFMSPQVYLTTDSVSILAQQLTQCDFALLSPVLNPVLSPYLGYDQNVQAVMPTVGQVCHYGVHFSGLARTSSLAPFALSQSTFTHYHSGILAVPAVSYGLVALSKADYLAVNGFTIKTSTEHAIIGLCFALQQQQRQVGVLLSEHVQVRQPVEKTSTAVLPNSRQAQHDFTQLQDQFAPWFRRVFREAQFNQPGFWHHKPLAIAMVVSEVALDTDKADYFTAKELGEALSLASPCVVGYFDASTGYDFTGYDAVMVYIDNVDPRAFTNVSPHCVLIGWARNWFDSWCDKPWIEHYDMVFASSLRAQQYMQKRLKRQVGLLRIAAAAACLTPQSAVVDYRADYVFTGSYFKSPREITEALDPAKVPYRFKLFGHNWQDLPHFGQYSSGPVAYTDIPTIYASTRLVIDDANIATKQWGALNCRLYDALAAGVLCITNNSLGVAELFDDEFPTYDISNLNTQITELLSDNERLVRLANKYRAIVHAEHTYGHRASQLLAALSEYVKKPKLAIKIAAPNAEASSSWGDLYFAIALREGFEQQGFAVRIDCIDQWYNSRSVNDDSTLVLRGLSQFIPRSDQQNLIWLISHPDLVCEAELRAYQQIFVASNVYAAKLQAFTGLTTIHTLLQASAFQVASLAAEQLVNTPEHDILFIGNSRNEFRDVVRWCVEAGLPLAVYGQGWEQFIPEHYIKGQFLPNELVPYFYHKAKVVLNDHWPDMQRNGFVSNRVFDVICAGGVVVSNAMDAEVFAQCPAYVTFSDKKTFLAAVKQVLSASVRPSVSVENAAFSDRVKVLSRFL